jgi:two-component system, NarL family, nitrate/nitrite response regulator NarL
MRFEIEEGPSPSKPGVASRSARRSAEASTSSASRNVPSRRREGRSPPQAEMQDHCIHAAAPGVSGVVGTPIRVVVAAHHRMFAQGLQAMLRSWDEVVAVVSDGADVVNTVEALKPDVLLLGMSLPCRTGLDVLRDLKSRNTPVRVVIVTMRLPDALMDAAARLGASAFVPKAADFAELRKAIKEVLAGRRYLSPLLREHTHEGSGRDRIGVSGLTPRQQSIVRFIGRGFNTADIARQLGISVHTVSFHRKNIRQQMGFDSEWAVLRFAILAELSEGPKCVFDGRFACVNAAVCGASLERPCAAMVRAGDRRSAAEGPVQAAPRR